MNGVFAEGQRVVVRDDNEYDEHWLRPDFGPMRGHYGHVIAVTQAEGDEPPLIGVTICGRVGGPISPGIDRTLYSQRPRTWYFRAPELEHAD